MRNVIVVISAEVSDGVPDTALASQVQNVLQLNNVATVSAVTVQEPSCTGHVEHPA
jgi:hypothetical protein